MIGVREFPRVFPPDLAVAPVIEDGLLGELKLQVAQAAVSELKAPCAARRGDGI